MESYEVFVKFMVRWTEDERARFKKLQSQHYPPCPMVSTINLFRRYGYDSWQKEIGPAILTRVAAQMADEPTHYYTEWCNRGSKRRGMRLWSKNEFYGEINAR